MNDKRYKYILYIITLVILATISIQVYWNYKNYLTNKQQLINEVQISLDKAVDDYYAALAQKTTIGFSIEGDSQKEAFTKDGKISTLIKSIDKTNGTFNNLDSLNVSEFDNITIVRGLKVDSMMKENTAKHKPISIDSFKTKIKTLKEENDSLNFSNIELLTSKIVISIKNDSLKIKDVDSLLKIEFKRKNIDLDHKLSFYTSKQSDIFFKTYNTRASVFTNKNNLLSTTSKSTFLPKGSVLKVYFENETKVVLKRMLSGILISTLLVLAVISCLFYLLKIIKHQKQLAEIKNDLISNITHEFKTPIATIGVALESIKDFNVIDNKVKTKEYLELSRNQLSKLNTMVEKLLETASLDSEHLKLNKENFNIVELLKLQVEKHQMQTQDKQLHFNASVEEITTKIDIFHFDNAINNIIDNAIKYGGNIIEIKILVKKNSITILVSDNGKELTKQHINQVFEKFYRVPKGNTHDIKGFGIGLYYTKKIIEKHNGSITLDITNGTTFKILIPNE